MQRRLGRGLGSLLGTVEPEQDPGGRFEVPLASIRPNPWQPRKTFNLEALQDLADSIRRHGLLQPVVLRDSEPGYELISGERRWRAAQLAELNTISAVVRPNVSDQEMLELALVENVQRQDLDPIERAHAFRQMMEVLHLTQEQVAEKVGLKRATIANQLRLLELPEIAREALAKGLLSMGHARALLGLSSSARLPELIGRIAREELSVRHVEQIVRGLGKPKSKQAPAVLRPSPGGQAWIGELEARMREHLGTKVSIRNGPAYSGQIIVEYYGRDDLDRLCVLLAPQPLL